MKRPPQPAVVALLAAFAVPAAAQQISIGDVVLLEGDMGQTMAAFDVTFSPAGGSAGVTFEFSTSDGTATASGNDYQPVQGMLAFPPGQDVVQVMVPINGDIAEEPDEDFFVDLFNAQPTDVIIATEQGRGTILNDDVPMISIGDAAVTEGDAGQIDAIFPLTVSGAIPAGPVMVGFATRDGTATTADNDYANTVGQLTVPMGAIGTVANLRVSVNGDTTVEADEEFFLDLTGATGAGIADGEGRGTILSDDLAALSIDDVMVVEGDAGTVEASFTVTLSPMSTGPVTVSFATANATATLADSDYRSSSGRLTFPPGSTAQMLAVAVNGDTRPEPDEVFLVDLSDPVGATIADGRGRATIGNDDQSPSLIRLVGARDRSEAAGMGFATVERTGGSRGAAEVTIATLPLQARAGEDYIAVSRRLRWADGETGRKRFEVEILDDSLEEETEGILVRLSEPAGATLDEPVELILNILDDDTPSQLEPVGETRLTSRVDGEIEIQVRASRADGAPVRGARVVWTIEGAGELLGDNPSLTDGEGLAGQQLELGGSPGAVTVTAEIAGTGQVVTFEIVVESDLGELFDPSLNPGESSLATALSDACQSGAEGFGDLCDYLFGLEPSEQREVISELTPREAGALADLLLQSPYAQLLNVRRHLAARRGGGGSGSQVALGLTGQNVPLDVLRMAFAGEVEVVNRMAARIDAAMFQQADDEAADEPPAEIEAQSRFSFFASGRVDVGDRPGTELEAGFDLETLGLTIGLDYQLSPRVVVGGALGYVDTDTKVDGDGGGIDVRGYSVSGFATYFRERFWLDGILSYNRTDYDFLRNIDLPRPFEGQRRLAARGRPQGSQLAVDLGAGYDSSFGATSLSGFGRLSYIDAEVDAFTEEGGGPFSLALRSQQIESLLLEAGVEIVRAASRSWGVLQPVLRASVLHEFEDDSRVVFASFAADAGNNMFQLPTDRPDRDYFRLGAGLTATLAHGRGLYFLYETDLGREDLDLYRLTAGLRQEF